MIAYVCPQCKSIVDYNSNPEGICRCPYCGNSDHYTVFDCNIDASVAEVKWKLMRVIDGKIKPSVCVDDLIRDLLNCFDFEVN
jgi:hypothetical protein